jgi:mannose-6-phosphate isomerase-like protein (cupin superfamily)
MRVRRIVTGMSPEGKSVVVSDEQVEVTTASLLGSGGMRRLWASDETVNLTEDGPPGASENWFPPPGGFRFALVVFGPDSSVPANLDMNAAVTELSQRFPGLVETLDPQNPVMHTSDTVDFNFIVSGEIWLDLDDGRELLLKAGDSVIQNGTRHAWHNRSSEPCTVAAALVGATRAPVSAGP